MTINATSTTVPMANPSAAFSYGSSETALAILFIDQMINELTPNQVWSIVEHAMIDISKVDPQLSIHIATMVRNIYRDKTANPSVPTTTPTTDSKESNLKGDNNATRKEATTMANINNPVPTTKSEAGELIASFTKNSLGDKLPKEYFVITGIVEAIPVLSKAVNSAMEIALIRAIITGEYPQLLKLSQGETLANARELVRALSNKNDNEVGITDIIKILEFGSYDCQIDKEGRIAATLLYNNLYK